MAIGYERKTYGGLPLDVNDSGQRVLRAQQQFNENTRTGLESAAFALPATFLAMADTFAESLGILDDNDMEQWLAEQFPDLGGYFNDNRAALGFVGDVAGSLIPGAFAVKAVRSAGVFGKLAQRTLGKNARFLTSTGKSNDELFQLSYDRARTLVQKGSLRLDTDPVLKQLRRQAIGRSVGDIAVEGIAADAAIALTMNESEFLFPPEASLMEHIAFFGGFNAVFSGAAFAIAKASMSRGLQRTVGPLVEQVQNPGGLPLSNLTTDVVGQRWQAATAMANSLEELGAGLSQARAAGDEELAQNYVASIDGTAGNLSDLFRKMFNDSPVSGVTRSEQLPDKAPELGTLQAAAGRDPNAFVGVSALETVGDRELASVEIGLRQRLGQVKNDIEVTARDLNRLEKTAPDGKEFRKAQNKLAKLRREESVMERMTSLVIEPDGHVASIAGREAIYQDGERKIGLLSDGGGRNNVAVANVEGLEIRMAMDSDIRLELPASQVTTKLDVVHNVQLDEINMTHVLGSIKPEGRSLTEDGLKKQLRGIGGEAGLVVSPVLRSLRNKLPSQFTGYVSNVKDSVVKLAPEGRFTTPVSVSRQQVWGKSDNNTLIFSPRERQRVNSATFTAMNQMQRTAVWDVGHRLADAVTEAGIDTLPRMDVAGMHHTELDTLIELHRRHGDTVVERLNGVTNIDDLTYRSLASKFEDYQRMRAEADDAIARFEKHPNQVSDNVARALNLPLDMHPLVQFFEGSRVAGELLPFDGIAKNIEEVREALRHVVEADEFAELVGGVELMGSMMRMNFKHRPVLAFVENVENRLAVGRDEIAQGLGKVRADLLDRLRATARTPQNPTGSLIASQMLKTVEGLPEALSLAKRGVMQLVQGNQPTGTVMSNFVQQRFRLRNLPGAQELDTIADITQKGVDANMRQLLKGEVDGIVHQNRFNKLMAAGNAGDQTMFFTSVNAIRKGWEIAEEPIVTTGKEGETMYQLALAPTATNKRIWRQVFDEEMPELSADGAKLAMPDSGSGAPVTMSQTAFDAVESMSILSNNLLNEVNALRHARNQMPKTRKTWHVPPRDFSNEHVVYLLDENGKVSSVVGAPTEAEARRIALQEQRVARDNGQYRELVTDVSMDRYHTARGEAFFEMTDFSRPSNQTGPATGKTSLNVIETGPTVFQSTLESLLRQFHDIGRETRMTLFEPELNALRNRKAASGAPIAEETIWDLTANRIAGTSNRRVDTVVGKAMGAVESGYDRVMQHVWDRFADVKPSRMGTRAEYKGLSSRLQPEHNPFTDASDFLQRTHDVRLPPELRKHAALLNEVTTALTLRIMDFGMAAINYASLATTMPPVIAMLKRLPEETVDDWQRRIGAFGVTTPDGIAQFSPSRAIVSGAHFLWSEEGRAVARRARDRGLFEQFAAEQVELFGQTGQSFVAGKLRRWSDALSKATDMSERGARALSWMTFYNVGRRGLGLSDEASMTFAHQQANQVIADFRPNNRPVIFQGAAGMPLGLFTTYMWNYFQRLYTMVESKAVRGLATQVGLQTALFGGQSLPGWEQYVNYFTSNYDGSENIVDRLNRAIGPEATEMFLNGSISSLTGINVSSRAATSLPGQLTDPGLDSIPGLRLAVRGYETSNRIIDSIKEQRGIDPQRMGEIIAASNLNKFASNAIELMQGYALDRRDNVIEPEVSVGLNLATASRVAGFKPLYADQLRAENRRNRTTDRAQAELKARLGGELQSLARTGSLTGEKVDRAIGQYMRAGGRPENFKRYYAQQLAKGMTSKLDREIADAITKSNDEARLARLLFIHAQTPRPPVELLTGRL